MFKKDVIYKLNIRQVGFTLIELMIALVLSALLLGAVSVTFLAGRAASQEADELAATQETIRYVSDFLIRDLRNAGFRDELSITRDTYNAIGSQYVRVLDDGSRICVTYSGRGSCGASPSAGDDSLRVVENYYFVDDGVLQCRGVLRDGDDEFTPCDGESGAQDRIVRLADRVTDIQFELMCPNGSSTCSCDLGGFAGQNQALLSSTCIGVRVGLLFEGGRGPDRAIELEAAFRNAILERNNFLENGS